MKNIILLGKMGSGKTTVAEYLQDNYDYNILSFATPVKQIAIKRFGMRNKDRRLLQVIGETSRIIKPTVWIEKLVEKIEKDKQYVIDDCRTQLEFDILVLDNNFIPIFIGAWEQIRVMRCINAGQEVSRKYLDDITETGFDEIANMCALNDKYIKIKTYTIMNNSTLGHLYDDIKEIVKKIND